MSAEKTGAAPYEMSFELRPAARREPIDRDKAVTRRAASPEVAALDAEATEQVFGARYDPTTGEITTSPADPAANSKLDTILTDPRYGADPTEREAAAHQYVQELQNLTDDGFALSQAKLIQDLRETDRAGYISLACSLICDDGMEAHEADLQAAGVYYDKDQKRQKLIKTKGAFTLEEYNKITKKPTTRERNQSTPYGEARVYSADSIAPGAEHAVIVPGYGEAIAHNDKLVEEVAYQGLRTFTFDQPREAGENAYKEKDPLQRQANILSSLLESQVPEREKVHAIAHSLGAAAVLRAAVANPDRFKSITLMQPAGMVGEQGIPQLLARVSKKVVKNQVGAMRSQDPDRQPVSRYVAKADDKSALHYSRRVLKAQLTGGKVLTAHPILAIKEALAAGKYDITEKIAEDKDGTKIDASTKLAHMGIDVNFVFANKDSLFSRKKVFEKIQANDKTGIAANSYSSVADRKADHDTFWLQPERTARIISDILRNARST